MAISPAPINTNMLKTRISNNNINVGNFDGIFLELNIRKANI